MPIACIYITTTLQIFFYMTQTSFSPGHASIYSKIPKSFALSCTFVTVQMSPHSSPQKWGEGVRGSLLWWLTKQQTTCQQLHGHSTPLLNITEQKHSNFQTNFQNVSALWYTLLSITPRPWTLFKVTFITHSNSHVFESTNGSICKTQCTMMRTIVTW